MGMRCLLIICHTKRTLGLYRIKKDNAYMYMYVCRDKMLAQIIPFDEDG